MLTMSPSPARHLGVMLCSVIAAPIVEDLFAVDAAHADGAGFHLHPVSSVAFGLIHTPQLLVMTTATFLGIGWASPAL